MWEVGQVKVVAKAKLEKSSNSPIRTAKLRLIGTANISKGHTETQGRASERRTFSSQSSSRRVHTGGVVEARRLGNQLTNQGHPSGEANAAAQPRVPVQAEKVFDNLSKTLAGHASQLPTEEQRKEQEIRKALVESLKHFDENRTALAKNLIEYKQVFKSQRQWTRAVTEIGAAIQVSARTVFRLIEDFERSQAGEVSDIMIDLSPIQGAPLNKEDRPFIRARLAIRSFLDEVPNNRKPQALAGLLAEEAYQIWGARNPFQMEVSPKPSRFTIDGRKKIVSTAKQEEGQE
jgi:hypothetical protein